MLRPGRLDKTLYVDLPNASERYEILKTLTRQVPLHPDVSLTEVSEWEGCEGMSGADLAGVVREAGVDALRELVLGIPDEVDGGVSTTTITTTTSTTSTLSSFARYSKSTDADNILVTMDNFRRAVYSIKPSVNEKDLKRYRALKGKLQGQGGKTPLDS